MNRITALALWVSLLFLATSCLPRSLQITPTATVTATSTAMSTATATATQTAIPPTATPEPPSDPIFGVEMDAISAARGLEQVTQAGTYWVRRNAVLWSSVESTEGTYNWSGMVGLESELQNASSKGIQVILIVRSTPAWAQKVPGSFCGPIKAEKFAAFATFMHDLVARYSVPPYNIKYWELWNEPDVDPSLVPADSVFGCWGDQTDAYYGGEDYAEMLKAAYPQIKAADPQAQVLVGGLLLDCDPRGSPSVCASLTPPHTDKPAKFLEGILLGGGGPYFDGVSFHTYDVYWGALGQYKMPNWNTAWDTTGPTVIAKAGFVKSVLTAYGFSGKFLMNTETAILCRSCSNDAIYETTKAYYVTQAYAAALAQGLRASVWYSVLGWQNSGLLNPDLTPRPAYTAFQFACSELRDATFVREITEYDHVKGYEFNRGDRRIWLLWSLDGASHPINLPGVPLAIYHVDGMPVPPVGSLTVTLEPLYLEWSP